MNRLQSLDPRIRKLIRAVCFCLLFALLFVFLSGAFIPRTGTAEDGMESRISKAYRGEPRNSVDAVFIGNSDIYRAISPVDLYHATGITSAIAGKPNKQLEEVPADIRDILRYQKPKTIVLETDCMFAGTNPGFKKGISPLEAEAAKVDAATTNSSDKKLAVKQLQRNILRKIHQRKKLLRSKNIFWQMQSPARGRRQRIAGSPQL